VGKSNYTNQSLQFQQITSFIISGTILAIHKANDNDRQTEDIDACGNKLTFFDLFFLLPRQVPPPFPAGVFFIFFLLPPIPMKIFPYPP